VSPTHTSTTTHTRTHTATFLSEVVMGAIGDILAELGIDLTRLYRDWDQDQSAFQAWIEEESLETVILECHQPGGKVAPIFEFPIAYSATSGVDTAFVESRASLARYRAKIDAVPSGTSFRLFCSFNGPRTPQPGWSPGNRSSTEGLRALSFGSLGQAPHASVAMRYLR
jgi:HORMA domain-containing protein